MSSNPGLGGVLTTIVYLVMVGDQMTSSSENLRISWRKGHVSSIYRVYLLTKALRMDLPSRSMWLR